MANEEQISKAKVFFIMPFTDDNFEVYELLKEQFNSEFDFSHASDEDNQQNILADIISPIYNADIVIADLTGKNPNVMYELGLAHCFDKKTIIITRDDLSSLPFDLKQYRAKNYSTQFKDFYSLIEYLKKHLRGAMDETVIFSNPVKDFLEKAKNSLTPLFSPSKSIQFNNDKGYLDFLADIDEDAHSMAENLDSLQKDMQTMTDGMNRCTEEIERAKQNGGQGTAAFARKQTRKVASYIETFSQQLKKHNQNNVELWTKIETNTLELLENNYSSKDDNKPALKSFLNSMKLLKTSVSSSQTSISTLKEASLNNLGLERSLNQAIRLLDKDLQNYIDICDQMVAGIDRILSKSKFVIGEID